MTKNTLSLWLLSAILFFLPLNALAQVDLAGLWYCNAISDGNSYPQDLDLKQSGTNLSGFQYYTNTKDIFATVTGSVSGNSISMQFDYISSSYSVTLIGELEGDTYEGTWTSSSSQEGTITCTRANSKIRGVALSLFCNRGGVNLSSAKCSATVGDIGPPPRSAPTGEVAFVAGSGFFPASGSCQLTQTQFSSGVSACELTFQVPFGFPVGSEFPISIDYSGDLNFEASSTAHKLIQAGCVGTPENPCSGAVALGFVDVPKVTKSILKSLVTCGGSNSASNNLTKGRSGSPRAEHHNRKETSQCVVKVKATSSAGKLLANIEDPVVYEGIAKELLRQNGARAFTADEQVYIDALYELTSELAAHEKLHQSVFGGNKTEAEKEEEIDKRLLELVNRPNTKKSINRNSAERENLRARRKASFNVGEATSKVKTNKTRNVKIKLNNLFTAITTSLRKSGINYAPLDLRLQSTREGAIPEGAKKKVKLNQTISAVLAQ